MGDLPPRQPVEWRGDPPRCRNRSARDVWEGNAVAPQAKSQERRQATSSHVSRTLMRSWGPRSVAEAAADLREASLPATSTGLSP